MKTTRPSEKEARATVVTICLYLLAAAPAVFLGELLGEAVIQHHASGGLQGFFLFLISLPLAIIAFWFIFRKWIEKSIKNQIIGTVLVVIFCIAALAFRLFLYLHFEIPRA